MNSKVLKRVTIGVALYVAFAVSVILFYPDKPEDMDWKDREEFNKVQVSKLSLGISRKEVLAILGPPDITEARMENGEKMQVMFYRTQHMKSDGITTQNECTPLVFFNDQLVALGDNAYETYKNG